MAAFYLENGVIEIRNPANGELVGTLQEMTEAQLDEVVARAREGFKEWSAKTQYERNQILLKFVALLMDEEEKARIGLISCRETGKPLKQSMGEFGTIKAMTEGYCAKAMHLYGNSFPSGTEPGKGIKDIVFTRREPLGVFVALMPFNYPVGLVGQKIIPALVAGNSVIIKPPGDNPLAEIEIAKLMRKAGVPEKAVQWVTGRGSKVGDYLASHPGINMISLTGSTEVGRRVYANASKNITRVCLECGGNDAFLVLEDADVELAVAEAMGSRVDNAGQICCASKRFIVHRSLADEFANKLKAKLELLKIGDPMDPATDMGCLINERAAIEAQRQCDYTVAQGATCILGGKRLGGAYFPPTVLTGVTADMDVAKDMEIFACVFPVIPFDTDEEAIAIANSSVYGLMGAVFSRDYKRALRTATAMECGGVCINGGSCFRTGTQPFGGYKQSGIGVEGMSRTLELMTQEKTFALKGVFL